MIPVFLLRFAEYAGAAFLFGAPLFLLYARQADAPPGMRRLLALAALIVALAAPLHFFAQTAALAGSFSAAADPATLKAAFMEMAFGKASLVRGLAALLALAALSRPAPWRACAVLGAITAASFAWMGHGAATEGTAGWIHLAADILHVLAASAWLGALAIFVLSLARKDTQASALLALLRGFSAFGIFFVGILLVTGIANSLFMIGSITALWRSLYGQMLLAKIALFVAMLMLAARNRALANSRSPDAALPTLRRNIMMESGLGLSVLALVAVLGMLSPP